MLETAPAEKFSHDGMQIVRLMMSLEQVRSCFVYGRQYESIDITTPRDELKVKKVSANIASKNCRHQLYNTLVA